LILLLACAPVDYDIADLQLDLEGAIPPLSETLRVCVEGEVAHEQGAGNGRAAVTGLWTDRPAVVRVELRDVDGVELAQSLPATLDADNPYVTVALEAADGEKCESDENITPDGTESWLLGIRFLEEPVEW
jgi:hypothetical protein